MTVPPAEGIVSNIGFTRPEYLMLFIPLAVFFTWYVWRGGRWTRARILFLLVRSAIILLLHPKHSVVPMSFLVMKFRHTPPLYESTRLRQDFLYTVMGNR